MSELKARNTRKGWPVAPPVPSETSFYLRFFAEVASIRDRAGRPLHEVDFRAEIGVSGVRRCPYAGSRLGRKMNWEALRVIAAEWSAIVGTMWFLRRAVPVREELLGAGECAWTRALLPMFLPIYICLKGERRSSTEVDTVVSGLFKVMLDVPTTLDLMLASEWAGGSTTDYTPSAVAEYAERTRILNNGEWTCAGPPGLIQEVLEPVCEEHEEEGTSANSPFSCHRQIDLDEFGRFASMMARQYALSQAFQVGTAFAMERVFAQLDAMADPKHRRPWSAYERRRRIFLSLCRDASSCRAIVRGFLRLSLRSEGSQCDGPIEACAEELLRLTWIGEASPKEALEAQCRAESLLRSAVEALHRERSAALGTVVRSRPSADFSRLDAEDFPSRILARRLGDDRDRA